MATFGVTLAPLLEELFFRGLFYPLVRRSVGVTPAVLLTATSLLSFMARSWATPGRRCSVSS